MAPKRATSGNENLGTWQRKINDAVRHIDEAIAEIISTFETDSDALLTNGSDAFVETLASDLAAFTNTARQS